MRERAVFYNSGPLEVIRLLNVALNPNVSSWKKKKSVSFDLGFSVVERQVNLRHFRKQID